jgi:hypothetical protein
MVLPGLFERHLMQALLQPLDLAGRILALLIRGDDRLAVALQGAFGHGQRCLRLAHMKPLRLDQRFHRRQAAERGFEPQFQEALLRQREPLGRVDVGRGEFGVRRARNFPVANRQDTGRRRLPFRG